jgi:hypothetical protein
VLEHLARSVWPLEQGRNNNQSRGDMRRFFIGALVGAGLMYFYLYEYGAWEGWAENRFDTVGSQYRGDKTHRQADQALH